MQRRIAVFGRSDAREVSRYASELGRREGLSEARCAELELVALELATNLYRHAEDGAVLLRRTRPERRGVELLGMDRGPGTQVARAMRDGFSTKGSAGLGLGTIRRLSDAFAMRSAPNGTVAVVRFHLHPERTPSFRLGVAEMPFPGEQLSGDGWAVRARGGRWRVALVDGLGHGPQAHLATKTLLETLRECDDLGIEDVVARWHDAAQSTRGAGALLADFGANRVSVVSVGNIGCRIHAGDGQTKGLAAIPGTLGAGPMPRLVVTSEPFPPESTLILHTDGIRARWRADDLGDPSGGLPSLTAATLLRDHRRERDDATCLVVEQRPTGDSHESDG
ncbi:MAG: SpoIIE family protein phosphatase [Myxococcales bacterium]|nr:SpoIIE family protein phosphatase [Myxococcales bacterium]